MDDRAAYFHTLVPTPGCPVKTSPSSLPARERVNAITSAAVRPSRYPSMIYVKTHVVARRNARGGRNAQEHLVAALRRSAQRRTR
jgi:hypothetical protein